MRTVCVIPARYASQRLPGKALIPIEGRPLVAWVIDRAKTMPLIDDVLVATDDERIAAVAREAGVEAVMTDPELPSGTDRIHAAMKGREGEVIINLQGDEPGMPSEAVESAHEALLRTGADVATACVPIQRLRDFESPNVVKVVRGSDDIALYFSRSPIPSLSRRDEALIHRENYVWGYKHFGLYIYTREALERFCDLPPSPLENTEKLEQLRMLENGMKIVCVTSPIDSIGVDVEDDLRRAGEFINRHG